MKHIKRFNNFQINEEGIFDWFKSDSDDDIAIQIYDNLSIDTKVDKNNNRYLFDVDVSGKTIRVMSESDPSFDESSYTLDIVENNSTNPIGARSIRCSNDIAKKIYDRAGEINIGRYTGDDTSRITGFGGYSSGKDNFKSITF